MLQFCSTFPTRGPERIVMGTTSNSKPNSNPANPFAFLEQLTREVREMADKSRKSGHRRANEAVKALCASALEMMEGLVTDDPDVTAARYRETKRLLDSANALLKSIDAVRLKPAATITSRALPTRIQAPTAAVAPRPITKIASDETTSTTHLRVPPRIMLCTQKTRNPTLKPLPNSQFNKPYNDLLRTAKETAAEMISRGIGARPYADDVLRIRGWQFHTFPDKSGMKFFSAPGNGDWEEWREIHELVLSTDGDIYDYDDDLHEYGSGRDGGERMEVYIKLEPASAAYLSSMGFEAVTSMLKKMVWR
jgi:hypothetical protein